MSNKWPEHVKPRNVHYRLMNDAEIDRAWNYLSMAMMVLALVVCAFLLFRSDGETQGTNDQSSRTLIETGTQGAIELAQAT
jgi:hypothetical protein